MPIRDDAVLGRNTRVIYPDLVNLYGCTIGDETVIGPFVEVQSDVTIGRLCKIQSHSFLCSGLTIEDEVFVGHGVMFVNDRRPRATTGGGRFQREGEWELLPTHLGRGCSIGSNATILGGVTIGRSSQVGAGAVVTADVPEGAVVAGVPARIL